MTTRPVQSSLSPTIPPHTPQTIDTEELSQKFSAQLYLDHLLQEKIIDEGGWWKAPEPPIALNSQNQEQILKIWRKPVQFTNQELDFSWNFEQFLKFFVPYFTHTFKGTTVSLTEGIEFSLGRLFCQSQLEKIIPKSLIPESLWSFCTTPPNSYALHVQFKESLKNHLPDFQKLTLYLIAIQKLPNPPSTMLEMVREFGLLIDSAQESERIQQLRQILKKITPPELIGEVLEIPFNSRFSLKIGFYFSPKKVEAKLEIDPTDLCSIPNFPHPYQWLHDQLISRSLSTAPLDETTLGKFWADLTQKGFVFKQEEIKIKFLQNLNNLDLNKAFSAGKKYLPEEGDLPLFYQWNVRLFLKNQRVDFFEKPSYQKPSMIGQFLLLYWEQMESAQHLLQIIGFPNQISWVDLELAIQTTESWLNQNPQECLTGFLKAFEAASVVSFDPRSRPLVCRIYKALLNDPILIKKGFKLMLALKKPVDEADLLAVPTWVAEDPGAISALAPLFEQSPFASLFKLIQDGLNPPSFLGALRHLLYFPEDKVLPLAWSCYKQSLSGSNQEVLFLLELIPDLEVKSLPYALNTLCQLPKPPIKLLLSYLDHSLKFLDPQILSYHSKLKQLLPPLSEIPPDLLTAYPKAKQMLWNTDFKHLQEQLNSLQIQFQEGWDLFHSLFKNSENLHLLVPFLQTLFEHLTKNRLWETASLFLDHLKEQDLYLEIALELMDKISQLPDPPLECFKRPIPKLEKRLSPSQKKRFATIYAHVILAAKKFKKEGELIGATPSLNWVMEQLQTIETLSLFTDLFLTFYPRYKLKLAQAFWIGTHHCDSRFIDWILQQKKHEEPEWRNLISYLIVQTDYQTKQLFNLLLKISPEKEKILFERCKELWHHGFEREAKSLLESYEFPSTKKEPLIKEVEKIIETKILCIEDNHLILLLLKQIPFPEYPLWNSFLSTVTPFYDRETLEIIWSQWLAKHPLQETKPEEEQFWAFAISQFFSEFTLLKLNKTYHLFFASHFTALLTQFETKACKQIATDGLRHAILACWQNGDLKDCAQTLKVMHELFSSQTLKIKLGDPWDLIDDAMQSRLIFLFLRSKNVDLLNIGLDKLMLTITDIEFSQDYKSKKNFSLFIDYCNRPHIPKYPFYQYRIHQWMEKSYEALQPQLDFVQTCSLMTVLSQFSYQKQGPDLVDFSALTIYNKWKELLLQTNLLQNHKTLFEDVSCNTLAALGEDESLSSNIFSHLLSIRQKFPFSSVDVSMFFATAVFRRLALQRPDDSNILLMTLCEVEQILSLDIEENEILLEKLQNFVEIFIEDFPQILLACTSEEYLSKLSKIIDQMSGIPWMTGPDLTDLYHWTRFLNSICATIKKAPPENQKKIEQFAKNIFIKYTKSHHSDSIKKYSCMTFGYFFLSQKLPTLSLADFKELIGGINYSTIKAMLFSALDKLDQIPLPQRYSNSLVGARLMRFMNPEPGQSLSVFELNPMASIPELEASHDLPLQLLLRCEWILAFDNLLQYYKSLKMPPLSKKIAEDQRILTKHLTCFMLLHIKDEESYTLYSPFVYKLFGSNLEILKAMHEAFQIPENIPAEIQDKLSRLKSFIQEKIK